MIAFKSFKEFINEAPRKPKEPNWAEDSDSGYGDLKSMQQYLNTDRIRLQLFVPKKRSKHTEEDNIRTNRMSRALKDIEDEAKLKEESIPVLTSYTESPVDGDNKPSNAFWTSTAREEKNGSYSSDWYELVKRRYPQWQTDYGFLFEVKSDALVIDTDSLEQYYFWANKTGKFSKETPDWVKPYGTSTQMRSNFPWKSLSRHFDAVHHNGYGGGGYGDEFTEGWDVESTAWFNTNKLIYKGAVKLWHRDEDEE